MVDFDLSEVTERIAQESAFIDPLLNEISRVVVGQRYMVERLLIGLLADGHVLLEGVPGLAKTLTVSSLARAIGTSFQRIQFTPDLLPADLLGTLVYNQKEGNFFIKKGPIFANIILADEINRSPAKVQSALLESMQERQVTIGETTFPLEEPFLVLATQNPIEQEGTYPLPEAQLDRFMLELRIGYPSREEEERVAMETTGASTSEVRPVLGAEALLAMQQLVRRVPAAPSLVKYAVALARATRPDDEQSPELIRRYVSWGAGPRASQYLVLGAKARAALEGRGVPNFDDVRAVAPSVLRHRVVTGFQAEADGRSPGDIVEELLQLSRKWT